MKLQDCYNYASIPHNWGENIYSLSLYRKFLIFFVYRGSKLELSLNLRKDFEIFKKYWDSKRLEISKMGQISYEMTMFWDGKGMLQCKVVCLGVKLIRCDGLPSLST